MRTANTRTQAARPSPAHRLSAVTATIAIALGGVLLTATPAAAATFVVMNTDDSGVGSLRDALAAANASLGADEITFDTTVTGTITLLSNLPEISGDVTIVGPGSGSLAIDGNSYDVFWSSLDPDVGISGVVVADAGFGNSKYGIHLGSGHATINDVIVYSSYGGLRIDGGTADVSNSGFHENQRTGIFLDLATGASSLASVGTSSNDGSGIEAGLHGDATLTMTDIQSHGNAENGMWLELNDTADITATGIAAHGNGTSLGGNGISADFEADATGEFTNIATHVNGWNGIYLDLDNRSDVSFIDTEAHGNSGTGFGAQVYRHAHLALTSTTTNGNSDAGVDVGAFTGASIEIDTLSATGNTDTALRIHSRGDGGPNNDGSSVTAHAVTGVGSDSGAYLEVSHGANATITGSDFHWNYDHGIFIDGDGNNSTGSFVTVDTTHVIENGGNANGGGIGIVRTHDLDVTISNSTIAYNVAAQGGGVYARLAGANPTQLTIVNSTIAFNSADIGGGAYLRSNSDAPVSILNSTIMTNTTTDDDPSAAAVYLQGTDVDIRNTIISGSNDTDVDLAQGTDVTFSYSLITTPSAAALALLGSGTGNIVGVDPDLGPLD
ncbi:MAG TPA: right-handed parallel beta-helix repeat-containing protein, partial [Terrimesophilobacter sp.]|nr:right-handed parallel beta-helix repeat-containing protein [Terrimesophilobacter sp.]